MTDDEAVLKQLSRGDLAAFEGVYLAHFARVRNFLNAYLNHNSSSADDVAQETFLQLWRRPNGFDPSRSSLRTYLFGIARKKAAEWWRSHPPAHVSEANMGGASGNSNLFLEDALSRLEPEARNLLWLREVEGYSYDELAALLAIPLGTVKSRLHQAREQLRKTWNRTGKESL